MSDIRLTGTVDVQAAKTDGKRPTFAIEAYTGEPVEVGGFDAPVILELSGMNIVRQNMPILRDHDPARIVGMSNSVDIDEAGVHITGTVTGDNVEATEVVSQAKNGFTWEASVGANIKRREYLAAGKKATVNGREISGPMIIARESLLRETSFVALGADAQTSATVSATQSKGNTMTETNTVAAAAESVEHKIVLLTGEYIEKTPHRREEFERIERLALEQEWTVEKTDTEMLRASRPNPGLAHRQTGLSQSEILEAALAINMGCDAEFLHKSAGVPERVVDAAVSGPNRQASIQDVFRFVAKAAGMHLSAGRMTDEDIRTAFTASRTLQASGGYSTYSIPGILSNSMNKLLLQSYMAVNSVARRICGKRNVRDFKESTSYRLTSSGTFELVGPTGEIRHGSMTEASYTNQAATYGKMYQISRTDIINDDLGALDSIPRLLGRQGVLSLEEAVFTLILANAGNFFHTSNNNLITDVFGLDGLENAEEAFLDQVDADGKPVMITPSILLVPTALATDARQVMNSTEVRTTVSNTYAPTGNPFSKSFELAVTPYINSQELSGSSDTQWYLASDPRSGVYFAEIAYLNGKETPTIEQGDVDFNTLGVAMRGYFDYGVSFSDGRAAVKSTGAGG